MVTQSGRGGRTLPASVRKQRRMRGVLWLILLLPVGVGLVWGPNHYWAVAWLLMYVAIVVLCFALVAVIVLTDRRRHRDEDKDWGLALPAAWRHGPARRLDRGRIKLDRERLLWFPFGSKDSQVELPLDSITGITLWRQSLFGGSTIVVETDHECLEFGCAFSPRTVFKLLSTYASIRPGVVARL